MYLYAVFIIKYMRVTQTYVLYTCVIYYTYAVAINYKLCIMYNIYTIVHQYVV